MIAWSKIRLTQLMEYCFLGALFCLPLQIFYRLYDASAYASGLFLIYQSFSLYLSDILFIAAGLCFFVQLIKKKQKFEIGYPPIAFGLLLLLACALFNLLFAIDPVLALLRTLRLFEYVFIYFFLLNVPISLRKITAVLTISLGFQIVLAFLQYYFQSSIGLSLLGEPYLAKHLDGVAKMTKDGATIIRPYGTFPHPNVLAGVLACSFFLLRYLKIRFLWLIRIIFLAGIIITFSRSALIAFVAGFLGYIFLFRPKISGKQQSIEAIILASLIAVILPFLWFRWENIMTDSAFSERLMLMQSSFEMIVNYPFGVGMNHFTLLLPQFAPMPLAPWDMQPVHNVFLLVASELGLIGGMLFFGIIVWMLVKLWQKREGGNAQVFGTIMIVLIVLMMADHYFWDLVSGGGYLWVMLGLGGRHVRAKSVQI